MLGKKKIIVEQGLLRDFDADKKSIITDADTSSSFVTGATTDSTNTSKTAINLARKSTNISMSSSMLKLVKTGTGGQAANNTAGMTKKGPLVFGALRKKAMANNSLM